MTAARVLFRDPIRAQWLILAISLLLIGLLLAYALFERRENILHSERERLNKQSEIVALNLQMQGENAIKALSALRALVPVEPRQWHNPAVTERLRSVLPVAGNFGSITLTDHHGTVKATTNTSAAGTSLADSSIFKKVNASVVEPNKVVADFSFDSVTGRHARLALPIAPNAGEFAGMIMVELNGSFSNVMLDSVRYTRDMRASMLTNDGVVLATMPDIPGLVGTDVTKYPDSRFAEHRDSQRLTTEFFGLTAAVGDMTRIGLSRRVAVAKNYNDQILHVFLSRDPRAVLAGWQSDATAVGIAYLGLSAFLILLQSLFYRRQKRSASKFEHLRAELAESETDLRTILDNLPVMVSAWDEQLRNRFLNPGYERVFGLNVAEQRGRHMRDVITPVYFERNLPFIERVLKGEPQSFELTINIPGVAKPMQTLMFYIPRLIDSKVRGFYVVLLDVTAMAEAQADTRLAKLRYDQLVEHIPVGVFSLSVSAEGRLLVDYASQQFLSMFDIHATERCFELVEIQNRLHEQDRNRFRETFSVNGLTPQDDTPIALEFRYWVNNRYRWIHLDMTQLTGDAGTRHWHGVSTDITEQHQAMEERNLAAAVFEYSQEAIFICGSDNIISRINPAFTRITGYTRDDVIGQAPSLLKRSAEETPTLDAVLRGIRRKGFWRGEVKLRRKTGQEFTALMSITMVSASESSGNNFVGSFTDISHLKEHAAALHEIAHYDPLTRIPNRRLLQDRLQQTIERTRRRNLMLAICYMDLDGFKPINDRLGHEAGDKVLITVADRLKEAVRTDDTVARLGGDEFVFLLCDLNSVAECHQVLDRVLSSIEEPIPLGEAVGTVSASIGVAIFPHHADDPDALLRCADQAMYSAKNAGKRQYRFFAADETPHSEATV